VGSWTNGSAARPAATRTYVICEQQRPILYIRETFNPDIVPVDLAPVAAQAVVQPPPAPAGWSPASWRDRPALQQPRWPDARAAEVRLGRIAAMPGLVTGAECRGLLADLAQVAAGQGFLVHAGDCAETFAGFSEAALRSRHRLLLALAQVIGEGAGMPPVVVGRIAGQYSKPRSCQIDEGAVSGGGASHVANYFGDMINDVLPQPAARTPDPQRLLQAYFHSAATLNALRNLHAVEAGNRPRVHSSHEALVLSFEQALTRFDDSAGRWYSTSGHLIWIGERTRSLRGAHVEFASGIGNPVAVKIGPSATPEQVLAICERLDPDHVPGRLTLIARLGAASIGQVLPPLVEAVRAADHPVVWCCDPMHANTITTASGYKTRRVRDVVAEIRGFFDVLRGLATHPGGIHLEVASEDVTECVGGLAMVREQDLPLRFETACDPRLNPSQALECAGIVAEELSRTTGHGMEPRYPRVTACAY
jgi:3-deoxy-7-phosphoheptulonate synthase